MKTEDQQKMFAEVKAILATVPLTTFAIVGRTSLAFDLVALFRSIGAESQLLGIYDKIHLSHVGGMEKPIAKLMADCPSVAIIASDVEKEDILGQALPYLSPKTKIVIAGYGHFNFRNLTFDKVTRNPLVPSLANGYPNTLIHLFQCLQNAARLGLEGVVAEFGMFKGGTTMLLAQFVRELGQKWPVIGFDSFAGFPPRRSPLDMYSHPDCVFLDEKAVRNYVQRDGIEVVSGDIVDTARRLSHERVILAFLDTDNFTSASAVLDIIQDRIVTGGAIVFDHFTGRNRFLYTLGERIAAKRLLEDPKYFNLHDTGVFIKQR